jgi:SAM-dependent methyltransferase
VCQHAASIRLIEIDYVKEALVKARSNNPGLSGSAIPGAVYLLADLDPQSGYSIPLQSESQDSALASLLVSYLADPTLFLAEVYRVLRPGGRVVLSTLRPDADTSTIFRDGAAEIREQVMLSDKGDREVSVTDRGLRGFLNDAARLLDLEQRGSFAFMGEERLVNLLEAAGFVEIDVATSLGVPPQAIIAAATRR